MTSDFLFSIRPMHSVTLIENIINESKLEQISLMLSISVKVKYSQQIGILL